MNKKIFFESNNPMLNENDLRCCHFDLNAGNWHVGANWSGYIWGYYKAANLILDEILKTPKHDTLIFPALFLYRQYIELSIKYLVCSFETILEKQNTNFTNKGRHLLPILYEKLKNIYEQVIKNEYLQCEEETYNIKSILKQFKINTKIIENFNKLDSHSFALRYPIDSQMETCFDYGTVVDLPQFKIDMQSLNMFFDELENTVCSLKDYLNEAN